MSDGNVEVYLSTIWTDAATAGRAVREEKGRREKIREENCRRKRIKVREKVEKSQNTVFFPCFVAPEGQKVVAKAAGAEPSGKTRDEKLHAFVARSRFRSQRLKTPHVRSYFASWDLEQSARRCGAKHISKPKVLKTNGFRALLGVERLRKCMPLWRAKRISKSKCAKDLVLGALLEVERLKKSTLLWRQAHLEVKSVKNY